MKRIIFIIYLLSCLFINVKAQTVSYTYKPLAAEGCSMTYSVSKQGNSYYIIATVKSDRMHFLNEPTMKVRTFNDEVLTFSGQVIGNDSQTAAGIVVSNMVLPLTEISSTAQFEVTPEQFQSLKSGVAKIRLSMIPMNHERNFKKDKIGKKLYLLFIKAKLEYDNF